MTNETPTAPPQEVYSQQKIIQVSFWKAVSIISGAILVSVVGTAFTVGAVLNSDHFLLARTADDVTELQETKLDKDIYEIQQQQILERFDRLEAVLIERL